MTSIALVPAPLAENPIYSLIGFAISGFTLGLIAPLLFMAGGLAEPSHPSRVIAAVPTFGYIGGVAGPPLVGTVAEGFGLWTALLLMVVISVVIAAATPLIRASEARVESLENT